MMCDLAFFCVRKPFSWDKMWSQTAPNGQFKFMHDRSIMGNVLNIKACTSCLCDRATIGRKKLLHIVHPSIVKRSTALIGRTWSVILKGKILSNTSSLFSCMWLGKYFRSSSSVLKSTKMCSRQEPGLFDLHETKRSVTKIIFILCSWGILFARITIDRFILDPRFSKRPEVRILFDTFYMTMIACKAIK